MTHAPHHLNSSPQKVVTPDLKQVVESYSHSYFMLFLWQKNQGPLSLTRCAKQVCPIAPSLSLCLSFCVYTLEPRSENNIVPAARNSVPRPPGLFYVFIFPFPRVGVLESGKASPFKNLEKHVSESNEGGLCLTETPPKASRCQQVVPGQADVEDFGWLQTLPRE